VNTITREQKSTILNALLVVNHPEVVKCRALLYGPPFLAFGPNSLTLSLIRPAKVISFPMHYLVKMHCFFAILVV
jgi:hypothetical protein